MLEGARVIVTAFGTVQVDAVGFVSAALCCLKLLAVDCEWVA